MEAALNQELDLLEARCGPGRACLEAQRRLIEAMAYSLMAGGKRLRPLLALAGAEAVGGRAEDALPLAVAVELVHTYSLIHDDLPAMDDDSLRRGQPTCHLAFGEATAVLAGDGLLTLAFEILARPGREHPERALRAVAILAAGAGPGGMVSGQMIDINFEGQTPDVEALETMAGLKTAALIKAALTGGAALAGGEPKRLDRLGRIAEAAGLAFQIQDDLLDITGQTENMGKNIGADAARAKASYPAVLGLVTARKRLEDLRSEALAEAELLGKPGATLRELVKLMTNRNS